MISVAAPKLGMRERRAVLRVLRSGKLTQGSEVDFFEKEFSDELLDGRPVVAVNSGTSGQHLGIIASGLSAGDEVIVPSFTFAATANAVVLAGLVPVFCDINPDTFTLSADHLQTLVTRKTRAVMPVHLFGHPADMERINGIAAGLGLRVFEDAAQAHGALVGNRPVGTFSDFAMFSLYPTKNMTSGEGGMVSCRESSLARTVRLLRNQGMEIPYQNELIGFNNRMSELHAAIGRVQLSRLGSWNEKRRRNASFLSKSIEGVLTPVELAGYRHVFHQYTIRVLEDRNGFAEALRTEHGIGSGIYYPVPCHRLPSLKRFAGFDSLEETDRAAAQVLSIPVHPQLSKRDLEKVALAVNKVARAGA